MVAGFRPIPDRLPLPPVEWALFINGVLAGDAR
jgi:hypothetical protein